MNMKVSVFGNPDLPFDNLPFRILPKLRERFPGVEFRAEDPNELDLPEENTGEWVIIDTVQGIDRVCEVPMETLVAAPRVTAHDFDLGSYLLLIKKIHPDLRVRIIGVPMSSNVGEEEVLDRIVTLLSNRP